MNEIIDNLDKNNSDNDNLNKDNTTDNYNDNKITTDNYDDNINNLNHNLDVDNLKERIEELEKKKNLIDSNINDIENQIGVNEDNLYSNYQKIEKKNLILSKYKINQDIFNKLKEKILKKEIKIPELFINDYKIFKYLEDNNIIDKDNRIKYYEENYKNNYQVL